MSALRELIAQSAHRWIMRTFADCGDHDTPPDVARPECEQLADHLIADLGWPEAGP